MFAAHQQPGDITLTQAHAARVSAAGGCADGRADNDAAGSVHAAPSWAARLAVALTPALLCRSEAAGNCPSLGVMAAGPLVFGDGEGAPAVHGDDQALLAQQFHGFADGAGRASPLSLGPASSSMWICRPN